MQISFCVFYVLPAEASSLFYGCLQGDKYRYSLQTAILGKNVVNSKEIYSDPATLGRKCIFGANRF